MIGSIIGGLIGQGGANAAAGIAQQGGSQAYAANNAQLQRNYAALSPYLHAGQTAIGTIGQMLGFGTLTGNPDNVGSAFQPDPQGQFKGANALRNYLKAVGINPVTEVADKYTADPGYGFRLTEGNRALDRSAAAKGMLLSGPQAKALTGYNQDMASQEYGNWFQRYMQQNAYNYGQFRDALGDYFNVAGIGSGAANSLTGANTGLATATGNALVSSANSAANYTMQGANALASGIGSGINNLISGAYLFGGFGKGGGSSYRAPGSGWIA